MIRDDFLHLATDLDISGSGTNDVATDVIDLWGARRAPSSHSSLGGQEPLRVILRCKEKPVEDVGATDPKFTFLVVTDDSAALTDAPIMLGTFPFFGSAQHAAGVYPEINDYIEFVLPTFFHANQSQFPMHDQNVHMKRYVGCIYKNLNANPTVDFYTAGQFDLFVVKDFPQWGLFETSAGGSFPLTDFLP